MLTNRQRELLLAIIEEFSKTAVPVGSVDLGKKYNIKVSPATIRNEMVELAQKGFLEKEHISSGRYPTTLAWRWYINEALKEEQLHPKIEVEVKTKIFRDRFQKAKLIKNAVGELARITHYPAVAVSEDTIFYAGIADLLEYPEYQEVEVLQRILTILEDHNILENIFNKYKGSDKIKVLIGEEVADFFCDSAMVFTEFSLYRDETGVIGVVGPRRMRYEKVIPSVRYIADSLTNAVDGWRN